MPVVLLRRHLGDLGQFRGWAPMRTSTTKPAIRRFRVPAPPPAPAPPRPRLDPVEAAAALKISPRTLWAMTKAGKVPCVRIGRQIRYGVAVLERWIAAQSATAPHGPAEAGTPAGAESSHRPPEVC
jgi:excisionase family DNA binding protein